MTQILCSSMIFVLALSTSTRAAADEVSPAQSFAQIYHPAFKNSQIEKLEESFIPGSTTTLKTSITLKKGAALQPSAVRPSELITIQSHFNTSSLIFGLGEWDLPKTERLAKSQGILYRMFRDPRNTIKLHWGCRENKCDLSAGDVLLEYERNGKKQSMTMQDVINRLVKLEEKYLEKNELKTKFDDEKKAFEAAKLRLSKAEQELKANEVAKGTNPQRYSELKKSHREAERNFIDRRNTLYFYSEQRKAALSEIVDKEITLPFAIPTKLVDSSAATDSSATPAEEH